MSYIAAQALYDRLREVLQAGAGSLRQILAGTYGGDLPDAFTPMGDAIRAVAKPQVECLIGTMERSPSTPVLMSNIALYRFEVRVRVVHRVPIWAQISEADRDIVKANAALAVDVITQGLSYPGNLSQTAGGTQTGLVSGMLSHVKSTTQPLAVVEDGAALLETEHLFQGTIQSAPAVS